jgi:hypothetical protein
MTSLRRELPSARLAARLLVGVVALASFVNACGGGDGGTGRSGSAAGEYTLTSVNAKPLPYRVYSETAYSLDVTSGSIVLKTDGSFQAASRVEERVDNHLSVYADTAVGKWVIGGSTLTFTGSDSTKQGAQWSGSSITLVDSTGVTPLTFVYAKK